MRAKNLIGNTHLVQLLTDRSRKFGKDAVTLLLRFLQFMLYLLVGFRMLILETQVFQLCLDTVQPQTVGQRGINI